MAFPATPRLPVFIWFSVLMNLVFLAGWRWTVQQQAAANEIRKQEYWDARTLLRRFEEALAASQRVVVRQGFSRDSEYESTEDAAAGYRIYDSDRYGYFFQERVRTPTSAERAALAACLLRPGALHSWMGPKACGGFHPDWSIESYAGPDTESTLDIQICFGCGEVRMYGRDFSLTADLATDTAAELADLLGRKETPDR